MIRWRRFVPGVVVLSVLALMPRAGLGAQQTPRVNPGDSLRLRLRGGTEVMGTLTELRADALTLRQGAALSSLPLSVIDTLWVHGRASGMGAKRGALIGGVVAGATAAMACLSAGEGSGELGCHGLGQALLVALGGGMVGAGLGGFVGAGIGLLYPTWHLRFAWAPFADRR